MCICDELVQGYSKLIFLKCPVCKKQFTVSLYQPNKPQLANRLRGGAGHKMYGKRTVSQRHSIRDSGARLAFGSDTPIETFDPIVGIHAAVRRRRTDDSSEPDG
jgi:hypothetical protein